MGSVFTLTGFGNQPGHFVAIDARSGHIVWEKRWPEACYSGTTTTAGGLVFVGRNGGELQAYDAENGDQLWSFQTGAGANTTASFFERNGKQYVVFYAGGNSLAASPHGDNLWLFGARREDWAGEGGAVPAQAPGTQARRPPAPSNSARECDRGRAGVLG